MKDLPSVSAFPIKKKLDNSQERYYGSSHLMPSKKVNVISKINEIFASNNHVYKSRVRITFKNDTSERTIVGKTSTQLLTLTGEKINIVDIIDIEKI